MSDRQAGRQILGTYNPTKLGCTVVTKFGCKVHRCGVGCVFLPTSVFGSNSAQYLLDWIAFMAMKGMMKFKKHVKDECSTMVVHVGWDWVDLQVGVRYIAVTAGIC